jgi:thiosulfate reductase cytochrome b subunit
MGQTLKRIEIPIALTILATLLQVIPYYFDIPALQNTANTAQTAVLIIVAAATFVGVISILQVHGRRIQRQSEGWIFSGIVVGFTVLMSVSGLPIQEIGLGTSNSAYLFMFNNMDIPLGSTMYSILAFFITSAAVRAFKARNVEAAIVLLAGTLQMMSNAPYFVNTIPIIADIGFWIRNVPNMATMRGVMIGAALGMLSLAVRTLMGIERGYLRGGGEE